VAVRLPVSLPNKNLDILNGEVLARPAEAETEICLLFGPLFLSGVLLQVAGQIEISVEENLLVVLVFWIYSFLRNSVWLLPFS